MPLASAKRPSAIARIALLVAVLLLVLGAKFRLIERYGSDLPYWDQWDGEGDRVLRPYVEGKLTAADLFAPHNEHRPVVTRLLTLGLFEAGDRQWDGRVQMVANTALHLAVALLLVAFAWRTLSPPGAAAFGGLVVVLFSGVVSWENTLAGFQSQFYFALLFSALHIGGTLLARPCSWRWWLAPLAGAGALLSMASGPLSAIAILAAIFARALHDRRLSRSDAWMGALNVVLVAVGFWLKANVAGHDALKTATAGAWLDSFVHQLSWPLRFGGVGILALVPGIGVTIAYFRRRIDGPVPVALIGATTWSILQAAAIAYARGAGNYGYSSRYFDTLSIGVLIEVLSFAYLIHVGFLARFRRAAIAMLTVAVVAIVWGLAHEWIDARDHVLDSLERVQRARIETVRSYLTTHDPTFFTKRPWAELPYPIADRLAQLLDTPSLQTTLPASVRAPLAVEIDPTQSHEFSPAPPADTPVPPESRTAWYSQPNEPAHFTSAPIKLDHQRVTLFVAGQNLAGARLWLTDNRGGKVSIALPSASQTGWRKIDVTVRREWYRIHAEHNGAGWIGFTQPSTNALLSIAAERIVIVGPWLLALGAVAMASVFAAVWPRRQRAAPSTRHALGPALAAASLAIPLLLALAIHAQLIPRATPSESEAGIPGFALTESGDKPEAKFQGAAFVLAGDRARWWGTYVGGDRFTGQAISIPFTVSEATIHIPIMGYPHWERNSLALEILDPAGNVRRSIEYTGPNPGEHPGRWDLPTAEWIGSSARLVLTDRETAPRGWLAVSAPIMRGRPGAAWLEGVPRNYATFAIAALTIAVLLFLPGLVWRTLQAGASNERAETVNQSAGVPARMPASFPRLPTGTAFLALPGFALLVVAGFAVWIGGAPAMELLAPIWLLAHVSMAVWLGWRWWRDGAPCGQDEVQALGLYGCVVVAALAMGVLPLEVAQEFSAHSTAQGRMIASPPDHLIPYRTAVYFWHGKTGREDRAGYFGEEWSIGSRGPLLPLATAAAFTLFDIQLHDPPLDAIAPWPASNDGFYVARILAILTNALIVLAGAAVARQLAPAAAKLALAWLAVSPVVAINTDFIWPKLLATFFILLALEAVLARRSLAWTGVCAACAYLSHPVGGLFAIPLATFLAHRAWLEASNQTMGETTRPDRSAQINATQRALFGFGLVALLCLSPWLAYKAWLGFPDRFTRYPLGDGRGFESATSIVSWLQCRWSNLWLSLVPVGFYFSPHMHAWIEGTLSEPLRWAIGYAKTLPGEVGLLAFCGAVYAIVKRPPDRAAALIRTHFLVGALGLLLIFWGFSTDGLGRNCLEPLAVLTIVYAAAAASPLRAWRWILLVAALEALLVRVLGVAGVAGFAANANNAEVWTLGVLIAGGTLAPALWLAGQRDPK